MKRIVAICCILCACMCDVLADGLITLTCGASFREIPKDQCFRGTRTKPIGGVTYSYRIFKTYHSSGGHGLFENSDRGSGDKPIGLRIEKADVPSAIESINIPSAIDGIPIVGIGIGCFERCSRLKSVAMPKTVISISDKAFEGCISLETITLPSTVVDIGSMAFKGCRKLKSKLVFDNDVDVGIEAFYGCHELTSIHFKKGINSYQDPNCTPRSDVKKIHSGTFADCRKLCELNLPSDIRSIGNYAFSNCCALASITLSKNLHTIWTRAFADCKALTKIEIPMRTDTMLAGVFSGCTALKTVKLPTTLEEIWYEMFAGCTSLETIRLPNGIVKLQYRAFEGCATLKDISIPDHVTEIGVSCFEGCTSLNTVKMPLHLEHIKPCAFKDCSNLETLQLPPNVRMIDQRAFEGCSKLMNINIPNSIGSKAESGFTGIGNYAFRGCNSLRSLRLNDGCRCDRDALAGMAGLEEVDIPASLKESQADSDNADHKEYRLNFDTYFKDSVNMTRVNVRNMVNPRCPGTLKGIGGFEGFKKLTTVKLPDGLEEIYDSTFKDCISLSEITLPSSVKKIGSRAFAGCSSLKSINLPEGVQGAEYAFKGCPAYTPKVDPKVEAEKQAKAARKAAAREKAAKNAAARRERELKMKKEAEESDAKAEQARKKFAEEDAKREREMARREKKLEEKLSRIGDFNLKVENGVKKSRTRDGGGSGFFLWLLLMIAGAVAGVFVYAKKSGCSFMDAVRKIAEKTRHWTSRLWHHSKTTLSMLHGLLSKMRKNKTILAQNQSKEDATSSDKNDNMIKGESNVKFSCPHCGQHLDADCEMIGEILDCPACGRQFTVPALGSESHKG